MVWWKIVKPNLQWIYWGFRKWTDLSIGGKEETKGTLIRRWELRCHTGFCLGLNDVSIGWCKAFLSLKKKEYVHMHACVKSSPCVIHLWTQACGGQGTSGTLSTSFIRLKLTIRLSGWPMSPRNLPICTSSALGLQVCATIPNIFTWIWGIWLESSCLEDM